MNGFPVYTVSDITQLLKEIIEGAFPRLSIEGEISNFRPASTGHWYFTLKDSQAAISAVMFKNRIFRTKLKPREGMKVRVSGSLSLYAPRGSYQVICESIDEIGSGDILQELEERKRRLAAEGLFDPERKRPIPLIPKHVAVITSPTGAALRDILQVIGRRNAGLTVSVLPAAVQGEAAAGQLTDMLSYAIDHQIGEVIILGRGGGSVEDLLPFSDELLVRLIADSPIPVISAVGHEIDWALSDYAADLRAPTPSAAAELVTAEAGAVSERVNTAAEQVIREMHRKTELLRMKLQMVNTEAMTERITRRIDEHHLQVHDHTTVITELISTQRGEFRHRMELARRAIELSSPKGLLERGWSLTVDERTGNPVTTIEQITEGMRVRTHVTDGSFISEVREV